MDDTRACLGCQKPFPSRKRLHAHTARCSTYQQLQSSLARPHRRPVAPKNHAMFPSLHPGPMPNFVRDEIDTNASQPQADSDQMSQGDETVCICPLFPSLAVLLSLYKCRLKTTSQDHQVLLSKRTQTFLFFSLPSLQVCLLFLPAPDVPFAYQQDIRTIYLPMKVCRMSHHRPQVHRADAHIQLHPIFPLLIPCHLSGLQHHTTTWVYSVSIRPNHP